MGKPFQFSLKELIVIVFVLAILLGLLLPVLINRRPPHRLTACLNNLRQLGLACHMYADVPGNNDLFPNDGQSACHSMNLLYDKYAMDYKLWVCPMVGKQDDTVKMEPSPGTPNLNNKMTSYGYDRDHKPDDADVVLLSDMGPDAGPGKNSTSHGVANGVGRGQHVVDCSGSGRFMDNTILKRSSKVPDDDIFQDDTKDGKLKKSEDSWIRND